MKAYLLMLLTESDNKTASVFRWLAFTQTIYLSVLAGWVTFKLGQPIDFNSYAIGVAALWAAAGIGERVAGTHTEGNG
jgi:hypothetical protein